MAAVVEEADGQVGEVELGEEREEVKVLAQSRRW
jgi:hypothetical protein